jgi:hypothetical protein
MNAQKGQPVENQERRGENDGERQPSQPVARDAGRDG